MPVGLDQAAVADVTAESVQPSLALRARLGALSVSWGKAAFALDLAMIAFAVVASELGARAGASQSAPPLAIAAFALLCLALYQGRGLYAPRLVPDVVEDAKEIVVATTIAAMALLSLELVSNVATPDRIDAGGLVRVWGFTAVYVLAGRLALWWSQAQARRSGEALSLAIVVGAGPHARLVARRLVEHHNLGLLPVGFVATGADAERAPEGELPIPILGSTDQLDEIASRFDATQIVVTMPGLDAGPGLRAALERCEASGLSVAYVPGVHEKIGRRLRVEHVGALPLITAQATDPKGWQFALKYAIDRAVATVLVLLVSPVLLVCGLAVLGTMGRPVFFRQSRVGVDGHEFGMLKFRSMRGTPTTGGEADAAWKAAQLGGAEAAAAVQVENRVTPVGSFLRRTSLDELPQLLNVMLGDMSLVGPRPERTSYVRDFETSIHRYSERHRVKSGITGWAQVNGLRGNTSLADRAEWDNWYIENFSLWLDLKILVLTAAAVLRDARRRG